MRWDLWYWKTLGEPPLLKPTGSKREHDGSWAPKGPWQCCLRSRWDIAFPCCGSWSSVLPGKGEQGHVETLGGEGGEDGPVSRAGLPHNGKSVVFRVTAGFFVSVWNPGSSVRQASSRSNPTPEMGFSLSYLKKKNDLFYFVYTLVSALRRRRQVDL